MATARLLSALTIASLACAAADVRANDLMHVANCRLVDGNGPVKAIGVNYVDGFWDFAKDGNRDAYLPALDALADAKVPFVRMAFGPWGSNSLNKPVDPEISRFVNNRDIYFKRLDTFLEDAKARHIRVVLDVFWNIDPYVNYFGEPPTVWSNPQSKTVAFLRDVVSELGRRHGNDPEILMVEFLNEGNLLVDFPGSVHTRDDLTKLMDGLSVALRASGDKHLVDTGNSLPRPAASHLSKHEGWNEDSRDDFLRALGDETPAGTTVTSVHLYPEAKSTRSWDADEILNVLPTLSDYTRKTCHPTFVGEFGATDDRASDRYIESIAHSDVQLAAVWGFGRLRGQQYAFWIDTKGKLFLKKLSRYLELH